MRRSRRHIEREDLSQRAERIWILWKISFFFLSRLFNRMKYFTRFEFFLDSLCNEGGIVSIDLKISHYIKLPHVV